MLYQVLIFDTQYIAVTQLNVSLINACQIRGTAAGLWFGQERNSKIPVPSCCWSLLLLHLPLMKCFFLTGKMSGLGGLGVTGGSDRRDDPWEDPPQPQKVRLSSVLPDGY